MGGRRPTCGGNLPDGRVSGWHRASCDKTQEVCECESSHLFLLRSALSLFAPMNHMLVTTSTEALLHTLMPHNGQQTLLPWEVQSNRIHIVGPSYSAGNLVPRCKGAIGNSCENLKPHPGPPVWFPELYSSDVPCDSKWHVQYEGGCHSPACAKYFKVSLNSWKIGQISCVGIVCDY